MSYDEKAVVKIDADGGVLKCAKGLASGDCGYSPEAKVCGKCGAMAVQVKMVPVADAMSGDTADIDKRMIEGSGDEFEDELAALDAEIMRRVEKRMKKKKQAMDAMADEEIDMEDEDMEDEEPMAMPPGAMKGWNMGKRPYNYKKTPGAPMPDDMDDEMMGMEDEVATPPTEDELKGWGMKKRGMRYKKTPGAPMADDEMEEDDSMIDEDEDMGMEDEDMDMDMEDEDMDMEDEDMDMEDEEEPMVPAAQKMRKGGKVPPYAVPDMEALRMARLRKMGTKSADVGMNGYLCAIDRKVYPGSTTICDDCPGGCVPEKGMPGLLHVEGLAESMFSKSEVIDSGYSPQADMFVVDVKTAQGHVNEVFIDGTTAEVLGFHRLDNSVFEQKSLVDDLEFIDFNEAADLATKALPGEVIAVEPALLEDVDVYKVGIEGVDGKSYDAFVSLDGAVLGWDILGDEGDIETSEIEAEAAEIALKRAFSEEKRQEMAKEGAAMPDGSFPIASEADLRNAIQAHGRAKDIEAAKRHIMKRARALGMENLIPTEWSAGAKSVVVEGDGSEQEFLRSLIDFEILSADDSITNN